MIIQPAHTYPVFPSVDAAVVASLGLDSPAPAACKAWTCLEYVDPGDPTLTCCLHRMTVGEAIAMLNGKRNGLLRLLLLQLGTPWAVSSCLHQ